MKSILHGDPNEVLERITPQPIRRTLATAFTGVLGTLLLYIAFAFPPRDLPFLALLLALGAGTLWLSFQIWQATSQILELTREELREADGRVLCRIEDIASVDRGFFAFKPAGGFNIRLKSAMPPRVYAPGLWWRSGKQIMIGGATAARQSKSMADLIKLMLNEMDEA